MLTPEQIADGWIEHDGGPCPVEPDSRPTVLFRDGEIADNGEEAASWVWEHQNFGRAFEHLHIIAYRPEPRHD